MGLASDHQRRDWTQVGKAGSQPISPIKQASESTGFVSFSSPRKRKSCEIRKTSTKKRWLSLPSSDRASFDAYSFCVSGRRCPSLKVRWRDELQDFFLFSKVMIPVQRDGGVAYSTQDEPLSINWSVWGREKEYRSPSSAHASRPRASDVFCPDPFWSLASDCPTRPDSIPPAFLFHLSAWWTSGLSFRVFACPSILAYSFFFIGGG